MNIVLLKLKYVGSHLHDGHHCCHVNDSASPTTRITLAATPSPQPQISRNITLIVEFQGELGNYLSKLASARITQ
jgi:hypothetical protein